MRRDGLDVGVKGANGTLYGGGMEGTGGTVESRYASGVRVKRIVCNKCIWSRIMVEMEWQWE
jgi:hypothetical protein